MFTKLPHPSRATVFVMHWTRPCFVVLAFLLINLCFWLLSYQRLNNPKLMARMRLEAQIIALRSKDGHPETSDISKLVKQSGLSFQGPTDDEKKLAHDNFCKAAVNLSKSDPNDADFKAKFETVGLWAKLLSDRAPEEYPTFWEKLNRDYFEFGGVCFRTPEDIPKIRQNAIRFLNYKGIFDSPPNDLSVLDRVVNWNLIALYDYKRAQLNNTLPAAFSLLALSTGFLLRLLYVDYMIPPSQFRGASRFLRRSWRDRIWRKRRKWIPIWEFSVANRDLQLNNGGGKLFDLLLMVAGLAVIAYELYVDDPEVRTEWILNCFLFPGTIILIILLLWGAIRLSAHKINNALGGRSPQFWIRVFGPVYCVIMGALVVTLWGLLWSVFILRASQANERITTRGTLQGIACLVLFVLLSLLFVKFGRRFNAISSEQRIQLEKEDEYNQDRQGFCQIFFARTDERFFSALIMILFVGWVFLLKVLT